MTFQPRLTVIRTLTGKLRLDIDGEPAVGVMNIDCIDNATALPAEIIITLDGRAVHFATETANNGEN